MPGTITVNSEQQIYQQLGKNICLAPFFGAFYQTNNVVSRNQDGIPNSVRPCSLITNNDRNQWDIANDSVSNTRNNETWKQLRKDMLAGRLFDLKECQVCTSNECNGATSPRQSNIKFLTQFSDTDLVQQVRDIEANDYESNSVISLDYYPSNFCNYSCIMCDAGASTQRMAYEIRINNADKKVVLNPTDPDFFSILSTVQIINFTGGETVLQKQVFEIIDYLIQQDLAKNIVITLLTNASSSPAALEERFSHFKQVIYNVSVDGTHEVIEYQRRGCSWPELEKNALELMTHRRISTVVNYVLTAVNVLSSMDFINWAYDNKFGPSLNNTRGSFINISPVFRLEHLGQGALPPALRSIALARLHTGAKRFKTESPIDVYYAGLVNSIIAVIETTAYNPTFTADFVSYIQKEDRVSARPLHEVVPEWAPYFQS
jgi:hypothetical protein